MGRCRCPRKIKRKNINITKDDIEDKCYKVSLKLNDSGDNILVISNYPRRIEEKTCSRSLRRVLNYIDSNWNQISQNDIECISIVNIFDSHDISNLDSNSLYNEKVVNNSIKESDIIIAAWGEPYAIDKNMYTTSIEKILLKIREDFYFSNKKKRFFKVGEFTSHGYPKHILAWKYEDKVNDFFN